MIQSGRASQTVMLAILIAALWYFIRMCRRSPDVPIRRVSGLDALDECIGRATELGRPIHYTMGNTHDFDAQVFASFSLLSYAASQCARYSIRIIATTNKASIHPVVEGIVKQSFVAEGKPNEYRPNDIRYFSDNQLAYASACIATMNEERIAANLMFGPFQAESLMFCETGHLLGAMQIAGTAFTHQLPFFVATCDYTLIGEELFAAGAYLSHDAVQLGSLLMQDLGKGISIALILLGSILVTMGNNWILHLVNK